MDYDYIENLVILSKTGDEYSKEKLIEEFRPFIINLLKRMFIPGYEFDDIMNECYIALFKCISLYKTEMHRFVAYAINGIKNNIHDLIRKSLKNSSLNAINILDNHVEETYKADIPEITDLLCNQYDNNCLKYALNQLTQDELNLINYIFYLNNTLKSYAYKNQISYSCAVKKKKYILDKLFMNFNIYNNQKNKHTS